MTNSFFNFQEAPDYVSILAESYQDVNAAFDRNEQLERENDKTREINAAMPLKMIEALADFAPTLKKAADKMAMDRYIKNSAEKVPWLDKDNKQFEEYQSLTEQLDEVTYFNDEQKTEALKEKNVFKYDIFANDDISKKKT